MIARTHVEFAPNDRGSFDTISSAANFFAPPIPTCIASPHPKTVRHKCAPGTLDVTAQEARGICSLVNSFLDTNFSTANAIVAQTPYCTASPHPKAARHKGAPETTDITAPNACGMCSLDRNYLSTNSSATTPRMRVPHTVSRLHTPEPYDTNASSVLLK